MILQKNCSKIIHDEFLKFFYINIEKTCIHTSFIKKNGPLSNKNETYKEFNTRLSLGNLYKIKFSIFNPIRTKYLHHNTLSSILEYDEEFFFAQIELNIEISILQRFPRESLILNSL